MEALIDLGEARGIRSVEVDCLRAQGSWIFLPRWVELALSADGQQWNTVGRAEVSLENNPEGISERIEIKVPQGSPFEPARYLLIHARNRGPLPEWHPGAPENAWLFVDEIVVR